MLSVWREATNKLACYTDRPLAKELGSVTSIEPVGRLTVAVGVESGRVVVVKLDDCPVDASARTGDGSPVSAANSDGRKRIVAVRHPPARSGSPCIPRRDCPSRSSRCASRPARTASWRASCSLRSSARLRRCAPARHACCSASGAPQRPWHGVEYKHARLQVAELRSTTTKGQVPDDFGASPAACALPPAVAKRSMLNTALRRFADAFKLPSMPVRRRLRRSLRRMPCRPCGHLCAAASRTGSTDCSPMYHSDVRARGIFADDLCACRRDRQMSSSLSRQAACLCMRTGRTLTS